MLPAAHGIFESLLEDALDLVAVIDVRIEGGVASVEAALLAEIHAAGQLAEHEEVGSVHQFLLKRGLVDQRLEGLHGAQVGIQAELLAHGQQALLRTHLGGRIVVIFGVTDGAEEHRVAIQAGFVGHLREGVAKTVDGAGAHVSEMVGHLVSELAADGINAFDRLADDFGADAVPGKKGNVQFHFS